MNGYDEAYNRLKEAQEDMSYEVAAKREALKERDKSSSERRRLKNRLPKVF